MQYLFLGVLALCVVACLGAGIYSSLALHNNGAAVGWTFGAIIFASGIEQGRKS